MKYGYLGKPTHGCRCNDYIIGTENISVLEWMKYIDERLTNIENKNKIFVTVADISLKIDELKKKGIQPKYLVISDDKLDELKQDTNTHGSHQPTLEEGTKLLGLEIVITNQKETVEVY